LRDEGPSLSALQAKAVYEHISGWRFFDVDLYKARQDAFIPEYPEEVPRLENDTSNLSAFLYALWRRSPNDFDTINQALGEFIDLPQKI
jgi:predicted ATPase